MSVLIVALGVWGALSIAVGIMLLFLPRFVMAFEDVLKQIFTMDDIAGPRRYFMALILVGSGIYMLYIVISVQI